MGEASGALRHEALRDCAVQPRVVFEAHVREGGRELDVRERAVQSVVFEPQMPERMQVGDVRESFDLVAAEIQDPQLGTPR
jgi:hypothetical protein